MANMIVPTGLDTEEAIRAQIARAQLMRNTLPSSEGQAVGPLRVMSVGSPLAGLIQGFDADYRERQALDALKVLNENRQKAIEEEIGKMPGGGVEDQPDLTGLGGPEGGGGILPPTPAAEVPGGPFSSVSRPVSGAAALPGSVAASQGASPSSVAASAPAVAPSPTQIAPNLMPTPGAPGGPLAGSQGALPAAVRAMNPEAQAEAMNRWASRFATLRAPTDSKFNPAAIANAGIEAAISQPGKAADRRTQLAGQLAVAAANAEARGDQKEADRLSRERIAMLAAGNTALARSIQAAGVAETQRHNRMMESFQQGKVEEKQAAADMKLDERNRLRNEQYSNIERTIDGLLDEKGNLNKDLDNYVGKFNSRVPDYLLSDATLAAGSRLETLQNQLTMMNIADAKKAADQSFGSMQVAEWPRFEGQIANIRRGIPGPELQKSINYVRDYMKTHRDELNLIMERAQLAKSGQVPRGAGAAPGGGGAPPASLGIGGYDAAKQKRYEDWKKANGIP